jgi:hypothetical protein
MNFILKNLYASHVLLAYRYANRVPNVLTSDSKYKFEPVSPGKRYTIIEIIYIIHILPSTRVRVRN